MAGGEKDGHGSGMLSWSMREGASSFHPVMALWDALRWLQQCRGWRSTARSPHPKAIGVTPSRLVGHRDTASGDTSAWRRDTVHNTWPYALMPSSIYPSAITIPTSGNRGGGFFPPTIQVFNSAPSTFSLTPYAILFSLKNTRESFL